MASYVLSDWICPYDLYRILRVLWWNLPKALVPHPQSHASRKGKSVMVTVSGTTFSLAFIDCAFQTPLNLKPKALLLKYSQIDPNTALWYASNKSWAKYKPVLLWLLFAFLRTQLSTFSFKLYFTRYLHTKRHFTMDCIALGYPIHHPHHHHRHHWGRHFHCHALQCHFDSRLKPQNEFHKLVIATPSPWCVLRHFSLETFLRKAQLGDSHMIQTRGPHGLA